MFLWRIVKYDLDAEERERSSRSGSWKRTAVKVNVRRLDFEVGCFHFFHCSFCIYLLFLYFYFFLFYLFVCYQFYQFFSCLLICLFLTLFSFERTVVKVSVLTAQGSEGSYDEDSRWAGGQVPCLHMAGESASADYL